MNYTIAEISKMANVAKSTVSKALNGQKGVSEAKRQEILKLVGDMNYRPNLAARALAKRKTETIGLVIPADVDYTLSGVYWSVIIASVAEEASKRGYNLLLMTLNKENPLKTLEDAILKQSADGLIFPSELLTVQEYNMLSASDMPFVIQGRAPFANHCCVDVRSEDGAFRLTKRLVEKGFRHIGCVTGPDSFLYTQERISGFKKALAESSLDCDMIIGTLYSESTTKENVRKFLDEHPAIDALFLAAGGEFAFYVFEVLKERNVDMGKFGIAVFDECRSFGFLPFPVISGRQPIRQMGAQDARNLFQLIDKETPPSLSLFDIEILES
ncbi:MULTISPECIES: LacI family DNA-binding transcriptional regulator [Treponema]|uniref:Transcriptional regulator, LacI family n=2 Tax=Treponema saccharophilum TaxID=165 RepID=H7EHR1_9SPIR|nr:MULTISPECIES: LacI family DNA-binding transcriptional regulator [Treponema]EIC02851.1 transcriptional regulator, LacI family [Treponema saccharophilum DSM 2985]MBQ5537475.1 LacI family DNA-binding transcriptional regulator [Treponema sp.]BDC97369.1 LacI family transcriptional regulator [Treponema saccharophilum]